MSSTENIQTSVNVQQTNTVDSPVPSGGVSDKSLIVSQESELPQPQHELPPSPMHQDDDEQTPRLPLNVATVSQSPQPQPPQSPVVLGAALDPQTVQLLREANAQYQYQINSRYEEKTRPVYGESAGRYDSQSYPYFFVARYPYYKENTQYQELGNGQRRTETNSLVNEDSNNVKAQLENQDQSSYTQRRSQSYLEYGKGEMSPDYNTYAYKRTYY